MARKKKATKAVQIVKTLTWGKFKQAVEQNKDVTDDTMIFAIDIFNVKTVKEITVEVDSDTGLFIEQEL